MRLRPLNEISIARVSFRQIFRLIFVIFCLYLLGDAFYRWDGFSYYASFSEFLPAVALASILWSLIAFLSSVAVWFSFQLFHRLSKLISLRISFEHLVLCSVLFIFFGAFSWEVKKSLWPYVQTTIKVKSLIFFSVAIISAITAYLLRSKAGRWTVVMQERIAPLVGLFGIFIILSVPFVSYHVWIKKTDGTALKIVAESAVRDVNRPNIILVTFDALAAREMSAYGYHRETTPFINRWSENATVFLKAEASSNFTTPSAASLMTGKRVWTHQTYHIEGTKPIRSRVESLPSVLRDNGYFNIALVVNPFASVKVLGISDSFDIAPSAAEFSESSSLFGWKFGIIDVMLYRTFGDKIRLHNWILKNDFIFGKFINLISRNVNQTEVPPEKTFKNLLEIIDNNVHKPFFVWIHAFPPHDPYLPPEPFKGKFNPSSELRAYKGQERLVEESYKYLFRYQSFPEEMQQAVNVMRDYYDESIAYIDKIYEDFIVELDNRRIENSIVLLSADHGESFENGYFTHGGPFLYEQVTHIPLIIKEPGQKTGLVVSDLVEQIDIPATILDLANIPAPSWMEGRSLAPLMHGEKLKSKLSFSMNFEENPSRGHQINRGSIAVWEGDYKLIHYLGKNESLLFNLKKDLYEDNNLFDKEPEIRNRLLTSINENIKMVNENIRKDRAR